MLPYGQPPSVHASSPLVFKHREEDFEAQQKPVRSRDKRTKEFSSGLLAGYLAACFASVGLHAGPVCPVALGHDLNGIEADHHVLDLLLTETLALNDDRLAHVLAALMRSRFVQAKQIDVAGGLADRQSLKGFQGVNFIAHALI